MSRTTRALTGAIAIVVALTGGAVLLAVPAEAHVQVVGTSPSADTELDAAPPRVEVRFDSGLLDIGYAMVVRSADGRTVSTGPAQLGPDSIGVSTDPGAGPGRYTVAFRVVSADGHEVTSSFGYTVTGTPAESPSGSPSPASSPSPAGSPSPASVETPSVSATPNPPDPRPSAAAAGAGTSRWSPGSIAGIAAIALVGAGLLGWALLSGRARH